jgi:DNA-binding MarR family transcriptional regulator
VNPAHLLLGTDADNVRDKVERERQHRGEGSPMSKLTDSAVRCIRALYAERQADQKKLAELYGVDQAQISRIVSGKAWRHVR